ncbi:hypothetical protein BSG1_20705 [Bacillus sp. SG-1]|nr:hypothetical protein BSG1_20705 [Bacillus sp. SG-1]
MRIIIEWSWWWAENWTIPEGMDKNLRGEPKIWSIAARNGPNICRGTETTKNLRRKWPRIFFKFGFVYGIFLVDTWLNVAEGA